jgi:hypothetical protein
MLVTALSPHIGYDKASAIAHKADDEGTSLREAALALGVSANDFDRIVDPKRMVGNPRRDLGLEHTGTGRRWQRCQGARRRAARHKVAVPTASAKGRTVAPASPV